MLISPNFLHINNSCLEMKLHTPSLEITTAEKLLGLIRGNTLFWRTHIDNVKM